MHVFSYSYWLAFTLAVVLCTVVLFCFLLLTWKQKHHELNIKKSNIFNQIESAIVTTCLAIVIQDVLLAHNVESTTNSTRSLLLVICLFGMMNYFVYNAGLISVIMAQEYEMPIRELSDFLIKPNYQLLVRGGSFDELFLSTSYDPSHKKTV